MNFLSRGLVSACAIFLLSNLVAGELPYIGEWSNGRGETLMITAKTIRFAKDKPVPYRDLTRATDGQTFLLEITAPGEVNAFAQKFLALACGDDEMKMVGYRSLADSREAKNPGFDVTWYKEDDSAQD